MSLQIPLPYIPAKPLQTLAHRAEKRPSALALRARRRGAWLSYSWSQVADEAHCLAQAWAALGLARGDAIVALGPLSFDFIVALFAADTLGVTLNTAAPDSEAEAKLVRQAQWAFVEGSHELERLLRHRTPLLRHAILVNADLVLDTQAIEGLALHSVDSLLAAGATQRVQTVRLDEPNLTAHVNRLQGAEPLNGHSVSVSLWDLTGLDHRDRLLADFDTTWQAGLHFILQAWPTIGSLLLIPEPQGDASTDRRQAQPTVWLAPPSRLDDFFAELAHRQPSDGLAGLVSQAALRGESSPWAALARWRIKSVLGLHRLRVVLGEPGAPDTFSAVLSALGIRYTQGRTRHLRAAEPHRAEQLLPLCAHDGLDGTLVRSAT